MRIRDKDKDKDGDGNGDEGKAEVVGMGGIRRTEAEGEPTTRTGKVSEGVDEDSNSFPPCPCLDGHAQKHRKPRQNVLSFRVEVFGEWGSCEGER